MMVVNKTNKGMSLLEVLLVVGIMSVFIAGVAQIFDDWFKRSINERVASEMLELQDAAEQFAKLNHEYILNDEVPNVGDIAELDISDMSDEGFLAKTFRARNSFGQSMRVFVRNVNDNTVGGVALEVITVSDDANGDSRMQDKRLFDSALSGGPKMGLISAMTLGPNCCDGNIQSPNGQWSVALSDFSSLYNRTPDRDRGGYMAAYGRVSLNDDLDDRYLYRVEVEGRPELNRMMTNMDMNGMDITNAGTVISDNMAVGGNATLNGHETNGFSSPYVLSVRDNVTASNMTVTRNGNAKGDLVVQGDNDNTTYDLNVGGNFSLPSAYGAVATSRATVSTVQGMNSAAFDTMNVRGGSFTGATVVARDTGITGNVQTTFLQTSSAEINNVQAANAVTALTTVNDNTMQVNNSLNSNNNVAIVGNMNAGGVVAVETLKIDSLQGCGSGCP